MTNSSIRLVADVFGNDSRVRTCGFTILELLIVILIIAILMGISIPRLKGLSDESNVTQAKSEVKALKAAVQSYRMNHENTPPTNITTDLIGASPQIISAILPDPFNPNDPTYQYSQDGSYFAISSVGPNGIKETADISASGTVASCGDDVVATNGTVSTLDMTSDTSNCGTIGNACASGEPCTGGVCIVVTCTSFTYSDWGVCTDSSQARTIVTSSPEGCTGGEPDVLTQGCTIDPCEGIAIGSPGVGGGLCLGPNYMVMPADSGFQDWYAATDDYCPALACGYADWRLPSLVELRDVLYPRRVALGMGSSWYWSSTESGAGTAWFKRFTTGTEINTNKTTSTTVKVRCVRSP